MEIPDKTVEPPKVGKKASASALLEETLQSSKRVDHLFRCLFAFMMAAAVLAGTRARAANPVQVQGSASVVVGYPTGPSTKLNPYSINIYYLDPTGVQKMATITVPNVVATAGLPTPTAAQVEAASAAKTALIIAAINAAMIPVLPVTINGTTYNTLTAIPNINTTPGMYATGKTQVVKGMVVPVMAPANFSGYTVNGVTQKIIDPGTAAAKLGSAVYRSAGNTVTGEIGNGTSPFTPGGKPSGGSGNSGSMSQMTFGGWEQTQDFPLAWMPRAIHRWSVLDLLMRPRPRRSTISRLSIRPRG